MHKASINDPSDTNATTVKLLLVEDTASMALLISNLLSNVSSMAFEFTHVRDLKSAMICAAENPLDIILLDLGLPDSQGLATFTRLHDQVPDIPTVVFTGYDNEELALEALRQGAQDYLVKDQIDGKLLVRTIRYAIERKRAEEALRESERRYRLVAENISDVIWYMNQELNLTYISPSITRQRGFSPEQALSFSVDEIIPFEALSLAKRVFQGEAHKKRNSTVEMLPKTFELQAPCQDGSLIWVETTITIVSDEHEEPVGILGVSRDITGRKHAEIARINAEQQLLQSQKMEAIGRLAGGVAHDINNILGAIMTTASMIRLEAIETEQDPENAKTILLACKKGCDLTRNILGFARKGKYVKTAVRLNSVIRGVESLLKRTISKRIKINTRMEDELRLIEADSSQIEHALMNVCINAADAMQNGGTLTIATDNVELLGRRHDGTGLPPGDYVRLSVTDTGVGMDKPTLDKVFEPFFTTKPKGEGTGLGLSMVYGVIENHQGTVTIDSQPQRGTTVTFFIPSIASQARSLPTRDSILPPSETGQGGILIIDDEEMIRRSQQRVLEKLGYTVLVAENGKEALEIYREHKSEIGLVILDQIMPVMDGFETFPRLRSINPQVKVLLCSGYAKDEKIDALLENGASGFLQKPFDLSVLSEEVANAMKP